MYRAVIIYCLIAVGYAGTVAPIFYNRDIRQVSTLPLIPPSPQNYSITTYPDYVPVNNSTSPATESSKSSFLTSLMPYMHSLVLYSAHTSNYLLQILGAILLGTSFLGLICSYTPMCSYLEINEVKEFARAYASDNYVNDIALVVMKALEKYSNTK